VKRRWRLVAGKVTVGLASVPPANASETYQHHHQAHAPSWSVAVSTRCFQCSRSWAYFQTELRPRLWGWRSASRVRSHVWQGRPGGRFHSMGIPQDWRFECSGDVKWRIHPCHVTEESKPTSLNQLRQLWRWASSKSNCGVGYIIRAPSLCLIITMSH